MLLSKKKKPLVIDARNTYETKLGKFQGAMIPQTQTFRQFPQFVQTHLLPYKQTPIAMYCTGGVRCEKSTAYLLQKGFTSVYQLQGGILKYLAEIDHEDSCWQGECFVFDQRVSVTNGMQKGKASLCYGCQAPLTPHDCAHYAYEAGVSCPYCYLSRNSKQLSQHESDKNNRCLPCSVASATWAAALKKPPKTKRAFKNVGVLR